MPGLVSDIQSDFGAGMCPGIAPHLIPRNGVARLVNFLIDEDGSPYKRSGSTALTDAFGSSGLTFIWDGWLVAGRRTVIANTDDFGVLADDDSSITNLGGAGLDAPLRGTEIRGILFIDGGLMYAGARKADYSTGTVAATNGSTTVTGTGTSWTANAEKGMFVTISTKPYVVQTVNSDTELVLADPFDGSTATGLSYALTALATASGEIRQGPYAAAGQRLLSLEGSRVYMSGYRDPLSWNPTEDYHEFVGGIQTTGGEAVGDTAMIFTTSGVWAIGNMEQEIVDDFGNPQQPESQAAKELVLWGKEGIAGWQDSLVVPAADGVWLITQTRFTLISKSIGPLYREYVRAGHQPGLATVLEATYLLPILSSTGEFVDMFACRLDRPIRERGEELWPWTVLQGAGIEMSSLTVRVGSSSRSPVVLGAEAGAGSRVIQFGAFDHDGRSLDVDDTPVVTDLVGRDMATGRGENTVKKVRLRYELVDDPDQDPPTVSALIGTGARPRVARWDEARWDVDYWPATDDDDTGYMPLTAVGGPSMGGGPQTWRVNKRVRYMRPRFKTEGAASRFVVRQLEMLVRPSGRM